MNIQKVLCIGGELDGQRKTIDVDRKEPLWQFDRHPCPGYEGEPAK